MKRLLALLLVVLGLALAAPLFAQDDLSIDMTPDEQKDWLVRLLQDQLSTPERQIRLSNLDGALNELAKADAGVQKRRIVGNLLPCDLEKVGLFGIRAIAA